MQQPSLPSMPPMKPAASPAAAQSAAPVSFAAPGSPASPGLPRRLRQAVGYFVGGSLSLVLVVSAAELTFKDGLRPTDLMATFEARTELGIFNQRLGRAPGEHVLNEAQYRETLAQAERQGAARAELAYQRQLNGLQADRERVVQAYATLYQRTNIIAQSGVQMEAQALQFRQRLIEQTNGGRVLVLNIEDAFCGGGSEEACDAARKLRAGMIGEATELTEGDMARKVVQLMAGIEDPAAFVVHKDIERKGAPALP